MEGKGTTNAIYILRPIIEQALKVQKEVYLCFNDYTKAFERVPHEHTNNTDEDRWNRSANDQKCVKWKLHNSNCIGMNQNSKIRGFE